MNPRAWAFWAPQSERCYAGTQRGDYASAVSLYEELLARDPKDARVSALLTRAERGLIDQRLAVADAARREGDGAASLRASLDVLVTRDRLRPSAIDPPRATRIAETIERVMEAIRRGVHAEASRGRALAARALLADAVVAALLSRPELGALGREVEAEVALWCPLRSARLTERRENRRSWCPCLGADRAPPHRASTSTAWRTPPKTRAFASAARSCRSSPRSCPFVHFPGLARRSTPVPRQAMRTHRAGTRGRLR